MAKPKGQELQCLACQTLFVNVEAFDAHQHVVCSIEGLVKVDRGDRVVYSLMEAKGPTDIIEMEW